MLRYQQRHVAKRVANLSCLVFANRFFLTETLSSGERKNSREFWDESTHWVRLSVTSFSHHWVPHITRHYVYPDPRVINISWILCHHQPLYLLLWHYCHCLRTHCCFYWNLFFFFSNVLLSSLWGTLFAFEVGPFTLKYHYRACQDFPLLLLFTITTVFVK